jgi:hypothetical protein
VTLRQIQKQTITHLEIADKVFFDTVEALIPLTQGELSNSVVPVHRSTSIRQCLWRRIHH